MVAPPPQQATAYRVETGSNRDGKRTTTAMTKITGG
jgi:hypothetical protein